MTCVSQQMLLEWWNRGG